MDNDMFTASMRTSDQTHALYNTSVSSHIFSSPFIDHNTHEHLMNPNLLPSNVQEDCLNNLYVPNSRFMFSEGYGANMDMGLFGINSCDSFNSSYLPSRNHDDFLKVMNTIHPSYHIIGGNMPDYSLPRNELSLTLGSCSEKSCSVVTQITPKDKEELSLYCGPSNSVHFSHVLLGSRYLFVAQELLAEVVSHALGNSEEIDDSVSRIEGETRISFSSSCSRAKGLSELGSVEFSSYGEVKSQDDTERMVLEERKEEKTKLWSLLQMVDHRYNQCLENIQNVVTIFHNATSSSSPQILARFALQTITSTFKKLRKGITSQILSANQEVSRGKAKAFESSIIQKQWGLQLGRKDQQSWRPQRGLPERSVSVLRAWMFQNFLHPYPKDNDKHLLAVQSGLTRSQVSNWFINARVRLWKPMIEEMYNEIKKRQTDEGIEGDYRSHGNINNQRI